MRLGLLGAIALFAGIGIAAREASAYPQFQLALGVERCTGCHLSPAGGGLLNDYGRDEAGGTISRGGDGRVFHGAWTPPDWFSIGGDLRLANVAKVGAGEAQLLAFPMQADLYLRAARGGLSFTTALGVRGSGREPANGARPPVAERVASREHFVSYEKDELVVRAGRFYPVLGLRLPDHTASVRRHLGMYLYEEPYAVELAHFAEQTEIHATTFVEQPSSFLGAGLGITSSGAALLVERLVSEQTILGAQGRVAISSELERYLAGAVGKWWLGDKVLLLAELDVQSQVFRRPSTEGSRLQLAGYVGASTWITRGVLATAALHHWDPDVILGGANRNAADLHLQYFPRAHFELHLLARVSTRGSADDPGVLSILQLHYYL